ncbi:MAG: Hsp70 family protein [Schaedlerella sp.]|nr:Hsp70 family protein [Schaedlerella sp.]
MAIIGIDLGTTNSLVCVYRNGGAELIPNKFGSYLTPSAVSVLEDGSVLVGEPAKERKTTHPETTATSFKKDMGSKTTYKLGKREFLPEELSSFIISSLVEDAKNYLNEEIEEAVISVPAYFHDKQRAATKRAGKLANINVERILNEPSAAALASYKDQTEMKKFLVFDFGGGTLDVSIVACMETLVEILSVSGNNRLGGDDFDTLMAEHFLKEHGLSKTTVSNQDYAILVKKAELCKRKLSSSDSSCMQSTINGQTYKSEYDMKRLMEEGKDILQNIRKVISSALKDAGTKASEIQEIVMVGGSSKMPLIQSYIRHLFHRQPAIRTNCDEMIALGLGIFCGIKEKREAMSEYVLMDICPFSLGTGVNNPADPSRTFMSIIIPRNNVLPCSIEKEFITSSDMQKLIHFDIRQGENLYAKENLLLGEMNVDVTPLPIGQEKVYARFTYDINGILMVDIRVKSTGKIYQKVLSEKLSDKELAKRCKELEKLKVNPEDLSENRLVLDKLEALYSEISPNKKDYIKTLIKEFVETLSSNSPSRILNCRNTILAQLPKLETADPLDEFDNFGFDDSWDDPWNEENSNETFFSDFDNTTQEKQFDEIDWLKFYYNKYTS